MQRIKENIKKLRSKAGLSQSRLSKISGVSQSYISSVEQGTKTPSLQVIDSLSKALGCSPVDIIGETYFKNNRTNQSDDKAYKLKEASL